MNLKDLKGKVCGYNKKTLVIVLALLIIAGGAFFIGAKYEKSKLAKLGLLKNNKNEICQLAVLVKGEIVSKSDTSLEIKTKNGQTQQFLISALTKMSKKSTGSVADLVIGQQIEVKGLKNTDGSFSAQTIKQIVPANQTK